MPLLCDRPHPATVDFDASRFVITAAEGILGTDNRLIEIGDEVPRGMFDTYTLRCLYELHRIEIFSYAAQLPDLREACARRGVTLEEHASSLTREDLQEVLSTLRDSRIGPPPEFAVRLKRPRKA